MMGFQNLGSKLILNTQIYLCKCWIISKDLVTVVISKCHQFERQLMKEFHGSEIYQGLKSWKQNKRQILSEIMHAAVQSGTNVRSQSPKNQPSSSRQTSLVAKNKKSAYGTLHTTEHQIEVNMYQKTKAM